MLRWLLLLATASASSLWWCTGHDDKVDAMPEFSTDEEREMLRLAQEIRAIEVRAEAKARGKGPLVTEKLVEAELIKLRDEAHDRVHLRQNEEALAPADMEQLVPVQALLPAGMVLGQTTKEKGK